MPLDPSKFFGLPRCDLEAADVVILPLPLETTVTCGTGTWRAPRPSSRQAARWNCSTRKPLRGFHRSGRKSTRCPALRPDGSLEDYLAATERLAAAHRGKFLLALGGEHTVSYGVIDGLADDLGEVTVVHDRRPCRPGRRARRPPLVARHRDAAALGAGMPAACRSASAASRGAEHELIGRGPRITTYYAHQLAPQWDRLLAALRGLAARSI